MNYGSRAEIVNAVRRIATDVRQGKLAPEQIGDQTIDATLDSHGIPDPDLLVRTAGEHRISNFLLWQISYAGTVRYRRALAGLLHRGTRQGHWELCGAAPPLRRAGRDK